MTLKIKQFFLFILFVCNIAIVSLFNQIKLGVDLQGGVSIILKVNIEEYLKEKTNIIYDNLKSQYKNIILNDSEIIIPNGQYIEDNTQASVKYNLDTAILKYKPQPQEIQNIINQSIKIIHDRIDPTGTKEVIIQQYKDHFIKIQIPGNIKVDDVIKLLGTTAKLNFHIVEEVENEDTLLKKYENENVYLQKKSILSGSTIKTANIMFDEMNKPIIAISFDRNGSKKFSEITTKYIKRRLAIVLDDKILSMPMIQTTINNGQCTISGQFSTEEASQLAYLLQKGALLTSLSIESQNVIGPTLGEYFIKQSYTATYWIVSIITVFMLYIYTGMGVVALISLLLTMISIYSIIIIFKITLTLPGIIGILFTIGMAVDANVLINERIRELKIISTNTVYHAVNTASEAILDANITSFIVGVIMYIFGSGMIKSFAVMLCIGIICSVISAILISHTLLLSYVKSFKGYCRFLIKTNN